MNTGEVALLTSDDYLCKCSGVVNLLFQNLLQRIHDLARGIGVRDFRVEHRKNRRGEVVVALIIADREGPLAVETIGR